MSAVYDDDRPGMMRVHIAEQRADALCDKFTRDEVRRMARERSIPTGHDKRSLAFYLAQAGVRE